MGTGDLAPSFRYTRWGVRSDGASRNQAEFLLSQWFWELPYVVAGRQ